jgi:WD40 repeat protein
LVAAVGTFSETSVEEYASGSPVRPPLGFSAGLGRLLAAALDGLGYKTRLAVDPDRPHLDAEVRRALAGPDDCLVVHVLSHGECGDDPSRVLAVPECGTVDRSMNVSEWISDAQAGDRPVLFLVDLCYSGRAARLPWLSQRAGRDTRAWVLAGSAPDEPSFDGRFTRAAAEVLSELARNGLDTDRSRRYVGLSQIARRITQRVEAMPGLPQRVYGQVVDLAMPEPELPFFLNPQFRDDPLQQAIAGVEPAVRLFVDELLDPEHFISRVRRHFTGRRRQLADLAPWLGDPDGPALWLVSGSAGVGKSALIGALVCMAHPVLAQVVPELVAQITEPECRPADVQPMAAVHARQRRLGEIVASICRQLNLDIEDAPVALVEAIAGMPERPTVVLDALDEAIDHLAVMEQLLIPLAQARRPDGRPVCRLLVGARPWNQFEPLRTAAGRHLLDLDAVPAEEVRIDLNRYLQSLLAEDPTYAAREALAHALAYTVAERLTTIHREWGAFLVATLYARYLRTAPIPVGIPEAVELGRQVPDTLPEVLELELAGQPDGERLRAVLAIFSQAKGTGMPAEVAELLAPAFHLDLAGGRLRESIRASLFYLRTDTDSEGATLYRPFHQGLVDYLREQPLAHWAVPENLAGTIYHQLSAARPGGWAGASPYLLLHLPQHALEAGRLDELITDPEFLVHAASDGLLPLLPAVVSPAATLAANVFRASTASLRAAADPTERRQILAVDAARYGAEKLRTALSGPLTHPPRWASGGAVTPALRHVLVGHEGEVRAVELFPNIDGRRLIVTGDDVGVIRRWDVDTGRPVGDPLAAHQTGITVLRGGVLGGRPVVVSAAKDGMMGLWDLMTGLVVRSAWRGHSAGVTALDVVHYDGSLLAVSGSSDGVALWDVGRKFSGPRRLGLGAVASISCVGTESGPLAFVAMADRKERWVQSWDLRTGQSTARRSSGRNGLMAQFMSATVATVAGRTVVVSADPRAVRLWDAATAKPIGVFLEGRSRSWKTASVSLDGRSLLVGARGNTFAIWDLNARTSVGEQVLTGDQTILALAAGVWRDSTVVATSHPDGTVRVWRPGTAGPPAPSNTGHRSQVVGLATIRLHGEDLVVSLGSRDAVSIRALRDGKLRLESRGSRNLQATSLAVAEICGRSTAIVPDPGYEVHLYDLATGEYSGALAGWNRDVTGIATAMINGSMHAVACSPTAPIHLWDLGQSSGPGERRPLTKRTTRANALATTELHGRPVVFTGRSDVQTWDLSEGIRVSRGIIRTGDSVSAVAAGNYRGEALGLSVDSRVAVRLWDLGTGVLLTEVTDGESSERERPGSYRSQAALLATVDGRLTGVSSSPNGHVRIWDLESGTCLETLILPGPVAALAVAPDGSLLLGAGYEVVTLEGRFKALR